MIRSRTSPLALLAGIAASAALLTLAPPASAATTFIVRGGGFGHGIGMSQYGAYGYAKRGHDYRFILRHYYTGTQLSRLTSPGEVRVLLQGNRGSVSFSGASRANNRSLQPGRTYTAWAAGGGRVTVAGVGTGPAPLRVTGPGNQVRLGGSGRYRGALEIRPARGSGLNAINAVRLDDYVQGVIPVESPASWPAEQLKAQAVAARTYAITSNVGGLGYEQYNDTRSQVYRGLEVEDPRANAAARATAGQVVTANGKPVTTYFFSTSGGRTENIEFSFIGANPQAWLKSVNDPFDKISPYHRWGPYRYSLAGAGAKLGGLVKGSFRGIEVLRRGGSPRVVYADILGSGGRTRVRGDTLKYRFGLYDTLAYFSTISSAQSKDRGGPLSKALGFHYLAGSVTPVDAGQVLRIEWKRGRRWLPVGTTLLRRSGHYRALLTGPGTYRVRYGSFIGPETRVG